MNDARKAEGSDRRTIPAGSHHGDHQDRRPAGGADASSSREAQPADMRACVALADVSPGVRQALDSFARTIDAGHVAQKRPKPAQPWWERD